jgi:hypothetical protein
MMNELFGSEASLRDWAKNARLMKAMGTKLHHLRAAVSPDNLMARPENFEPAQQLEKMFGTLLHDRVDGVRLHAFVVEHDWARAFENAEDFGDDAQVRLPFPACLFEFSISGRRVAVIAHEFRSDEYRLMASIETPAGWAFLNLYSSQFLAPVRDLIQRQIRAICVALEAEVAETEVVRAPYKLNRARERRGKQPVADYHVVRLARRSRLAPLPEEISGSDAGRRVRLHFRRGHWRHYENHRTWIKWTLVGDPDIGFIDKHYRL